MQRDDVRAREQVVHADQPHAVRHEGRGHRVVRDHVKAQCGRARCDVLPDMAKAHQAEHGAGRLPADELPALVVRLGEGAAVGDVSAGPRLPRSSISANAIVSSATASAFLPGVVATGMPRSVAAAMSMLTGPPRAQQTSRRPGTSSASALTGAP